MQRKLERLLTERCCTTEEELDARLFAHIQLDDYLTGSHLEGDMLKRTTAYMIKMLMYMDDARSEVGDLLENLHMLFDNLLAIDAVIDDLQQAFMSKHPRQRSSDRASD